jgi:hypothetical protein
VLLPARSVFGDEKKGRGYKHRPFWSQVYLVSLAPFFGVEAARGVDDLVAVLEMGFEVLLWQAALIAFVVH